MARQSKIRTILLLPSAFAIFLIGFIIQWAGQSKNKDEIKRPVVTKE